MMFIVTILLVSFGTHALDVETPTCAPFKECRSLVKCDTIGMKMTEMVEPRRGEWNSLIGEREVLILNV